MRVIIRQTKCKALLTVLRLFILVTLYQLPSWSTLGIVQSAKIYSISLSLDIKNPSNKLASGHQGKAKTWLSTALFYVKQHSSNSVGVVVFIFHHVLQQKSRVKTSRHVFETTGDYFKLQILNKKPRVSFKLFKKRGFASDKICSSLI